MNSGALWDEGSYRQKTSCRPFVDFVSKDLVNCHRLHRIRVPFFEGPRITVRSILFLSRTELISYSLLFLEHINNECDVLVRIDGIFRKMCRISFIALMVSFRGQHPNDMPHTTLNIYCVINIYCVLSCYRTLSFASLEHINNERDVLMRIDGHYFVNLHRTFNTKNEIHFLMDVALGGELFTLLR